MKRLGMITMAHHRQTLDIISKSYDAFDEIVIIDGKLTKEIGVDYFSKLDLYNVVHEKINGLNTYKSGKLVVVDRPWDDNFFAAYQAHLDLANEGDWILILDSDEYPSLLLIQNFDKIIKDSNDGQYYNIVMLPVVDFLDEEQLWEDTHVPQQFITGMWTKHILLRKGKEQVKLHHFGSHVIPLGTKYTYVPYPYYHWKYSCEFISNEIWQMFLHPEGQRLSPLECARFKNACKIAGITSSLQFMHDIESGSLGPIFERLMVEYKEKFVGSGNDLHPLSQLGAYYWFFTKPDRTPPWEHPNKQWYLDYVKSWKKANLTYKKYKV